MRSISVRDATFGDIDFLIRFAHQVPHLPNGRRHGGRPPTPAEIRERYETLLANPSRRVLLAVDTTTAVLGMAVLSLDVAGELLDVPVVRVSHLVVDQAQRRRGAGRALVGAAGSYADELGIDHVMVGAVTTDREANRFLARLGFAPMVVRRLAPLTVLRRRLNGDESAESVFPRVRHGGPVRRALTRSQLGRAGDVA